ncbi:MAG: hemolysin family protein [Candidatus Anammoxibacter sp.]
MEPGSILSISTFLPEVYLSSILLFLSGFFSSSETALFSITREARKEMRNQSSTLSRIITSLLKRPKRLLITLLFGNMLVNVAFFCISYGVAKRILGSNTNNSTFWAGVIVASSLLTIIIFGEVIPKNIAVRMPVSISKLFAFPILIFEKIFLPFCIPLDFISEKISWFFSKDSKDEKNITVDELKMIVDMGERHGLVDETEHSMINAVLDFQEKQVKEVMVPRVDMVVYNVTESVDGFLDLIRKSKYTKIPVYSVNPDTIIGMVHAKDVFLNPNMSLREFVRPIQFIPETKTIESLLRKFRSEHKQMAVVIDEYGGTAGLVSLEDILEEIVGSIDDEHDRREESIKKISDKKFSVPGNLGIREWCDYFEIELESPDFDTIGGLVISLLGNIPKKGDVVEYENMKFTVDKLKKRRIVKLIMEMIPKRPKTKD